MKNEFGWNESEQDLIRIYKNFIQPKTNDNVIFPDFVDNENDKKTEPERTRFKFGKRGWIGIPNPFARVSSDIPSLPHFSFGNSREDEKYYDFTLDSKNGKTYNVWLVISGNETIERFLRISPPEEEKFIELCRKLSDNYGIRVEQKIKEYNFAQIPDYKTVLDFRANTMNSEKFKMVCEELEKILNSPRGKSSGTGVFPNLEIWYGKLLSEEEIHKPFLEMKEIFVLVSKVKTERDIKRNKKEISKLENELESLILEKRRIEKIIRIGVGDIESAKVKLKNIEDKIYDLENAIKKETLLSL